MNARTTFPGRRPEEEAELDRRIKQLTGEGPENNTLDSWAVPASNTVVEPEEVV